MAKPRNRIVPTPNDPETSDLLGEALNEPTTPPAAAHIGVAAPKKPTKPGKPANVDFAHTAQQVLANMDRSLALFAEKGPSALAEFTPLHHDTGRFALASEQTEIIATLAPRTRGVDKKAMTARLRAYPLKADSLTNS